MLNKLIKILVVPAVALSLSACGINSVPTAEENAKAKWADVESAVPISSPILSKP